jgi:LysM repeat protein
MKRRLILICLIFILTLPVLLGSSMRGSAQAGDPYSLIDAVNSLRSGNGLPSYETNAILMSIAQSHSDYQAAIGEVTHTGAGGTRPKDRAAAAGYAGGATFFISENIAGGTDLSIETVISWWLGDAPHIQTMLGSNYQQIGAGVSVSDGFVYYTIDVASGASGSNVDSPVAQAASTSTPGGPTAIPIYLVQTTTPMPDGSIVHTVLSGQTLIDIAKAYGVFVIEIKDLNYLTGDDIYVGDKLLIHPAGTPAPTSTFTPTTIPTRAATPTRNPTRTATPSSTPVATSLATPAEPAQKEVLQSGSDALGSILVIAIIVLAAGGVILMVVGSLIKRRSR